MYNHTWRSQANELLSGLKTKDSVGIAFEIGNTVHIDVSNNAKQIECF